MQERTEDLKLVYQINHSYYPNFDSFISKVVDFIEVYYRSKEITKISDLLFREYEVNEITIGDIVNTFEVQGSCSFLCVDFLGAFFCQCFLSSSFNFIVNYRVNSGLIRNMLKGEFILFSDFPKSQSNALYN